jgi:hypothetical protein
VDAGAARGRIALWIAVTAALAGASCVGPGSGEGGVAAGQRTPPQLPVVGVGSLPDPPVSVDPPVTDPPVTDPPVTDPPVFEPVQLLFTGDVLMHSPLWRQALVNGGATHDFAPMFADLRQLIEMADLAVCHLETPVAPPFEPYTTSPLYGVPAEVVDSLAAVGFDHCSTASNHTFDRGVGGVEATITRFEQAGITQHGMASAPADIEPLLLEVGGLTIGHVAATYGYDEGDPPPDEPWRSNLIDPERLVADARVARARGADVVVVSLHWGDSMSQRASAGQRAIAGVLAMSGEVDLVVGHHAHVVQPIERLGDMWVAYGLGNLVSNMPFGDGVFSAPATGDGVVLVVEFSPPTRRDDADGADADGADADGADADGADADGPVISGIVARPIWVDQAAGWVVRDVATARRDPTLAAAIGRELDDSWRRTAAVVGPLLPVDS